jgi:DNA-binding FadR family transcriptional regulator
MDRANHVAALAELFEQAILSGELAPGEQLPSERDISAQRKVSRSVVREALGRLASLGLVESRHGSGTRVRAPDGQQVSAAYRRLMHRPGHKLEDLSAVRLPLETAIAALAAENRTDDHLRRLDEAQRALGNPRRSLESHVEADLAFHAGLADATGNPFFAVVLAPIQELLVESRRRTLGRYGAKIAYEHHAAVLAAVGAQRPEDAASAMRQHIEANFRHLSAGPE